MKRGHDNSLNDEWKIMVYFIRLSIIMTIALNKTDILIIFFAIILLIFAFLSTNVKKNVILQQINVTESTLKWQSDTASWTKNW